MTHCDGLAVGTPCKIFLLPWRKRQMLGSIIKISKLIFAIFALRIGANIFDFRYINAARDSLSNGESRFAFLER